MAQPLQQTPSTRPKIRPWLVAARTRPRLLRGLPRRFRERTWLRYLAVLGPGIIAAAAGNDAGGIATYAAAGAQYGYSLLWAMLLITVSLTVVQEMSARLGAVTGKGLSDLIRERFGLRWTAVAMLTLLIANAGTTISEFIGIAASMELFGMSKYLSVPCAAVAIWWLVVKGSYRRVEHIFLVMTLVCFAYVVSAFVAHPDWSAVAHHTFVPTVHWDTAFLMMFVALVGTTITPYMQVFQQSAVVEKGITINDYSIERIDTISGVLFSNLVAFFIIVATGATLFVNHITIETAADAAKALAPLAGRFAETLFAIGLFGASMLAAGVLPLATSFSICEAFGWASGVSRDVREAKIFYGIFMGLVALGALVTLMPGLPLIRLLIIVQVGNGILLPIELAFMMILINDRELMGNHVNGPVLNTLAWGTTIIISLLAISLLVITVLLPIFGVHLG
jgi:NRAMP (natural resistance-associated macrophage protein)-like metal ion transporter